MSSGMCVREHVRGYLFVSLRHLPWLELKHSAPMAHARDSNDFKLRPPPNTLHTRATTLHGALE